MKNSKIKTNKKNVKIKIKKANSYLLLKTEKKQTGYPIIDSRQVLTKYTPTQTYLNYIHSNIKVYF